ncbi:hypothetical protein KIN20_035558 [Parelaphostrongylus tenuis]|uniref:Uncharacterized protein n=1 Tax=Parelaphostrongylus tenuis TaxID=148309 RepID=A0AAD5RBK8_PARTN|nr:hypothetical protein KIN20_035558 [Parelaphostrongylus tenuis]
MIQNKLDKELEKEFACLRVELTALQKNQHDTLLRSSADNRPPDEHFESPKNTTISPDNAIVGVLEPGTATLMRSLMTCWRDSDVRMLKL